MNWLKSCLFGFQILSDTDPFFISGARNVVVLSLSLPWVLRNRGFSGIGQWSKAKKLQLALRSICGNVSLMAMFYSFRHLPLGIRNTLAINN